MAKFTIALIVNPFAGIGGSVALKGSDGTQTREEALQRGAIKFAGSRTAQALQPLLPLAADIRWLTVAGEMGADCLQEQGFAYEVMYHPKHQQTEPEDTEAAVQALLPHKPDLILFAGGDGTARNIVNQLSEQQDDTPCPVLGIPAGCKIHSGVYAVTPVAAGRLVAEMVQGKMVSLQAGDVMDIDEQAFRQGTVKARFYGEMAIPAELQYVQAVKMGGKEVDELVIADIAAQLEEDMEDELYIMGSGSTVAGIMEQWGINNTLLGVDVIQNHELLAADVTAPQLLQLLAEHAANTPEGDAKSAKLVITLIGGQGHIFGRGNQQLSPAIIRKVGKHNIQLVAMKQKLQDLQGRPLIADTGDMALDQELAGLFPVLTGYRDQVLYPLASPSIEDVNP